MIESCHSPLTCRCTCNYNAAQVARKRSDQLLAELAAQDDGLPTKPIGVWSLWKLAALSLYFEAFTTACKTAGGGHYFDGFAGPGICRVRESDPPYFAWGSPLLALRTVPPFERCTFVELNDRRARSLEVRTAEFGPRTKVYPGDVNHLAASIIETDVPGGAPCFCLLDQQGGELEWSTVERIACVPSRRRKPEMMILFPLRMSLLRLLSVGDALTDQSASRWDSTLGNHDWFAIYQARLAGEIDPTEAQRRYLALYIAGLKRIGYKHVTSSVITAPRAPGLKRQEMYHLLFATDHDAGFRIMSDVMKRPYALDMPVSRQPTLFE